MLFNKHIIGIDPTDKSQLKNYSELSKANLIINTLTPEALQKELEDTTWVITSNGLQTEDQQLTYRHGQTITNNDPDEWSSALSQSDFTTQSRVTLLVLDIDEPNEMNPTHPAYNPDYQPPAVLRSRESLTAFLASLFGWVVSADSHKPSTFSSKGRYYIASTTPVEISAWIQLIERELHRQYGIGYITATSGSAHSMTTRHHVIDSAIYKGGHRVFTYLNKTHLTYLNPAKDVTKVISNMKRHHGDTQPTHITDITSPAGHLLVKQYTEQKATEQGKTVSEYKRQQANTLHTTTDLFQYIHNKSIPYTLEDISSLPKGNFRPWGSTDDWDYHHKEYSPYLTKWTAGYPSMVQTEAPRLYPVTYHAIHNNRKDTIPSDTYLTLIQATTGSGKTYSTLGDDAVILAVPTKALAEQLAQEHPDDCHYVPAGDTIQAQANKTMVVTHDKLSYSSDCEDFHVIIDEPHRLFTSEGSNFTAKRDKLIQQLLKPNNFKKVTLISAYDNFDRLFSMYDIDPDSTSMQIHYNTNLPTIHIYDNIPNLLTGRTLAYVNSVNKSRRMALHLSGKQICSGSIYKMKDIDKELTTSSIAFTSVGREGVSLKSEFDTTFVDATVGGSIVTGSDHTIQALSRTRTASTLKVRHYCKDKTVYHLSLDGMLLLANLLTGITAEERSSLEQDAIAFLPLFDPIRRAVHSSEKVDGWTLNRVVLVGLYLDKIARDERDNLTLFKQRIEEYGYTTETHFNTPKTFVYPKEEGEPKTPTDSFDALLEWINDLEGDKRDKEIKKLERLEASEDFDKISEQAMIDIMTDDKVAKKYYTDKKLYRLLEDKGFLSPTPLTIKTIAGRLNKLLSDKDWKQIATQTSRKHKNTVNDVVKYIKNLGLTYEWRSADGERQLTTVKGAKGKILHFLDGEEKYLPKKLTDKGVIYPIGGTIYTEDINKFYKEITNEN